MVYENQKTLILLNSGLEFLLMIFAKCMSKYNRWIDRRNQVVEGKNKRKIERI